MKTVLIAGLAALVLTGCASTNVPRIVEKPVVSTVPNEFFICPTVDQLPNPETLTNAQIADLIIKLDRNNQTCKNSLKAIKEYQAKVNSVT